MGTCDTKGASAGPSTCALYARVSSESQDVDLSISAQLKALRKSAADRGLKVAQEYVDEAKSARTDSRPAFKEMVSDALNGQFTAILVWKFSRFARNRRDSIIYKSLLRKHGVDVVSISEKIEDSPEGRLLEGMIEVIDQFYSDNMGSDIRRGMREAIERGFYVGGPVADGYTTAEVLDGDKKRRRLVLDKPRAQIIKEIFERYTGGHPVISIVADLNGRGIVTQLRRTWDAKAVYRVLRKPTYVGTYLMNGEVVNRAYCPPIVEAATFEAVQKMLDSHMPAAAIGPRAAGSEFLLAGLVKCAVCGNAYKGETVHGRGGSYQYYLCSGRSRRRVCTAPRISRKTLERAVLSRVGEHILSRENVEHLVELVQSAVKEDVASLRAEITLVRRDRAIAERALRSLYKHCEESADALTALTPRVLERQNEIARLGARENALTRALAHAESLGLPDRKTVARAVSQMKRRLSSSDFLGQKAFLQSLVQRIEVNSCSGCVKAFYTFPLPKLRRYWEEIELRRSAVEATGSPKSKVVDLPGLKANLLVDMFTLSIGSKEAVGA